MWEQSSNVEGPRVNNPRTHTATAVPATHGRNASQQLTSASDGPVGRIGNIAHRRSFLPQRSNSLRGEGNVPAQLQLQEDQLRQLRDAQPPNHTVPSHHETVGHIGDPKQPATSRPMIAAMQPALESIIDSKQPRPQMLPPTRLERAASLRQPVISKLVPPVSHLRHRSQLVGVEIGDAGLSQSESGGIPAKPGRPQFSTFQQHFSPKKPPKPPNPATTTSSSGELQRSITFRPDIVSLQTELLQLHILHSQALEAIAELKSNAEKHFRERHVAVRATYSSVVASEQASQQCLNVQALDQLAEDIKSNNNRHDFSEQIHILSRVVQEVTDLTDAQWGRYSVLVREFETWCDHVNRVKQARAGPTESADLEFIDPLSHRWREEAIALNVRLEFCSRELDSLDVVQGQDSVHSSSALVRVVIGHKTLLTLMAEQLEMMESIEAAVVRLERLWVKGVVNNLDTECKLLSHDDANSVREGVWKHFVPGPEKMKRALG